MRLFGLTFLFIMSAISCKARSPDSDAQLASVEDDPYEIALQNAAEEGSLYDEGLIPADQDLRVKLGLAGPSPESFQKLLKEHTMLMFIRETGITADNRRMKGKPALEVEPETGAVYSSPLEYQFNANLLVNCQKFMTESGFKDVHKEFFEPLKTIKGVDLNREFCASVKFTLRDSNPANRAQGDISQVNLYIDSSYRPYGIDVIHFKDKRQTATSSTQFDYLDSATSSLDFVPYDLPNLDMLSRVLSKNGKMASVKTTTTVELPVSAYIKRTLAKRGVSLCQGRSVMILSYRAKLGMGQQTVSWCQGDAWPSVISNDRFLSVLVRKPN